MNLKSLKLFVCLFIVTIVVAACSTDDKVVAVVNGEEITLKELNKRVSHIKKGFESQGVDFETEEGKHLEQEIVQKALDDLIEEALVRQQAEKEGVLLSEEEIDKKIEEIKASFSNIEEYQRELQNMNITESDLRKIILNEFSRENLFQKITNNINAVEDDQVWEYYKQNPEQFVVPETLVVRHILFFAGEGSDINLPVKRSDDEARKLAEEVIDQLNQGADFAALAREKSEDAGTREEGGIYRFSPEQKMTDPEFSEAAQKLKVGEYTEEPVRSQFGYHVIKLEEIIPYSQMPFEEVKKFIENQLIYEAKVKTYQEYMGEVRIEAQIVKNL